MNDVAPPQPQYLRIRNWESFQHYKDRDPKWIKLERSMLADYELAALPVPTRLLYKLLLLVAARTDNNIPYDPEWIASEVKMDRRQVAAGVFSLVTTGFLTISDRKRAASKVIAKRKRVAMPEKRREEREKKEPGAQARKNGKADVQAVRALISNGVILNGLDLDVELRARPKLSSRQRTDLRAALAARKDPL